VCECVNVSMCQFNIFSCFVKTKVTKNCCKSEEGKNKE